MAPLFRSETNQSPFFLRFRFCFHFHCHSHCASLNERNETKRNKTKRNENKTVPPLPRSSGRRRQGQDVGPQHGAPEGAGAHSARRHQRPAPVESLGAQPGKIAEGGGGGGGGCSGGGGGGGGGGQPPADAVDVLDPARLW